MHRNAYMQHHLSTLRHDCNHLEILIEDRVLSSTAAELKSIYLALTSPQSSMPPLNMKRDLLVLFFMLHENYMLTAVFGSSASSSKSFLDFAKDFFFREFNVVDMVTLLNKVGFSIAPIHEKSTAKELQDCFKAAAETMNTLWIEFRERHRDDLVASGVFAKLPRFFAD